MLIKKFTAVNFCQHKNLSIDLKPGLTAILGPNGSGKSNFLNGIYSTITGDFTRNVGNKADNISQFCSDTDESYLQLDFTHAGVDVEICRSLRPNTNHIRINKNVFKKGSEIDQQLEAILGISKKLLSDFIFVRQRSIDGILNHSPAERAAAFQRLFGTWRIENCWQAVGDYINGLEVPSIYGDIEYIKQRINTNQELHDKIVTTLKELEEIPDDWEPSTDPCHLAIQENERIKEYSKELVDLKSKLSKLAATLEKQQTTKTTLNATLQEHNDKKTSLVDKHDTALKVQAWWSSYSNYLQATAKLDASIQTIKQDKDKLTAPVQPENYLELTGTVYEELSTKKARRDKLQHLIKDYNAGSSLTECPTCLTPTEVITRNIIPYSLEIVELNNSILSIEKAIAHSKLFNGQQDKYKAKCMELDYRLSAVEKIKSESRPPSLDGIKQVDDRPEWNINRCQIIISEYVETNARIQKLENELNQLQKNIDVDVRLNDILTDRLTSLEQRIAKRLDEETLAKLYATYRTKLENYKKKIQLKTQHQSIKHKIKEDNQYLTEVLDKQKERDKKVKVINTLKNVRDILHRDSLPKLMSQKYLELLEEDVNAMLEKLSSTFRIALGDGLSFNALFADGRNVPAERLSGGEKVILSLALRVVVNATFASDIGLLCLDEPTDSLDEDNMKCLEVALDQLKQLSQKMGLQCLLITHVKKFAPLFDNIIELG